MSVGAVRVNRILKRVRHWPGGRWLIPFLVRPRLLISVFAGLTMGSVLPDVLGLHVVTRVILGWDAGTVLYLSLAAVMMRNSTDEVLRRRAERHDEGRTVVLTTVVVAALVSLGAIVAELGVSRDFQGTLRYAHIGLAIATVLLSWAFTQVMFAQHYAHMYYAALARGEPGGLSFPGDEAPDYGDFVYFAIVIGTSGQTADVSFTSRPMRRIGAVHCVLAFLFNTSLVALTINIASGLI